MRKYWVRAALPLVLITGVEELLYWSDVVLLGFLVPSAEVSIYFAALRVMAITSFIHYAFMFVFAREFAVTNADGNKAELQQRVTMASSWTFWLTVPAVLAIWVAGPLLLSLFGPVFLDGQVIMFAIGIGILGKAFVGPAANLLIVTNHARQNVNVALVALITNVIISVVLIQMIGILGAAIGTALSQILRTILLAIVCKRQLQILPAAKLNPFTLRNAGANP